MAILQPHIHLPIAKSFTRLCITLFENNDFDELIPNRIKKHEKHAKFKKRFWNNDKTVNNNWAVGIIVVMW